MQKGRTYPYHPHFWVTTCFFWRGYLPWKWSISYGNSSYPIQDTFQLATYPMISQPGTIIEPVEAQWEWPVDWTSESDLITLNIKDFKIPDVFKVEWKMRVWLAGVVVETLYFYQVTPQYEAKSELAYWREEPYPSIGVPKAVFVIKPATYAEGGSPWP